MEKPKTEWLEMMWSCEAGGYRCASAEATLEGLGRDADDGEVSLVLTTALTDADVAQVMTCSEGGMEAARDEKRKER